MAEATTEPESTGSDFPEPEAAAPAKTVGSAVLLRDRFLIDSNAPLTDLDSPSAKAFAVEDRRDPTRKLYALICTPGLPPRSSVMALLKGTNLRGVLPLVEYDTVDWPPLGQRCMAVIYERPLGGRVVDAIASGRVRISEYDLRTKVLEPLVAAIHGLSSMGIAHREIRSTNLFYLDAEYQTIVLGDCVTTPSGFDQPIVFEPIEQGLASPSGRATGDVADDLYSLGVTLVVLMLGGNPVAKLSEDDLFAAKIEHGTYATLCGGARISLSLLEPLRGMLSDQISERWSLDQMSLWMDGRQMTPMQRKPAAKADNPFAFGGRNHSTPRTLARAMTQNVAEAVKFIRDESLETWLRRNLSDAERADKVRAILDQAKVNAAGPLGSDDYVVTRVAMVLDPMGPVRYKGFSFLPEGFGAALAVEFLRRGDAQIPAEALQRDLPSQWLTIPENARPESVPMTKLFAQMRTYLQINDPGYGVERCLYEMNPSLPCQSPLIIEDYVVKIEELLPALDRTASRTDTKVRPIDRHIAAFVAARFNQDIDPHLRALASPKVETSLIGMLSLLAYLQWKLRSPGLLGLSSWLGGLLGPAINTYHSRTTRREIEREIPRLVRQGSLPELFDLIDNAEKRKKDNDGYASARAEYARAEAEARGIETKSPERMALTERKAQQTAATTSIIMSMFIIMMTFLVSAL
jgi:hypothetical protein